MKLRHLGFSYNGNALAPDQFGLVLKAGCPFAVEHIGEIVFACRGGPYGDKPRRFDKCVVRITTGEADAGRGTWHWDGNMESPTLTPSIGCDHRCGWHGAITNGEIAP